ncbi:unnamed protein product [Haemonchus placei]|uniref:Uncharacterized protein n=1 Tax=Haemonchus placei TaxID=6290 RepID=A0A3P7Y3W9_HAEPC|nr:unnamed protein product [Haemonchus placei]
MDERSDFGDRGVPAVPTPNSFAKRSASDILSSPDSELEPIDISLDDAGTVLAGVSTGGGGGGGGGGNVGATGGVGMHDSSKIIFLTTSKSGGTPSGGMGTELSKGRRRAL